MKNIGLAMVIAEIICGAVCIGLGIYYCFAGSTAQIAVFLIVGAVCVITGIRTFILYRRQLKRKDEENEKK